MKLRVKLNRCQDRLLAFDSLDHIPYSKLRVLSDKVIALTITEDEPGRTLSQNDLMEWLYSLIGRADHIKPAIVKKQMKDKWGAKVNVNGALATKPTSDYTVRQAQEYIEHLKIELSERDLPHCLIEEYGELNT